MLAVSRCTRPCAKQLSRRTDGQTAAGTSARTDGPLRRCASLWKPSLVFLGRRAGRRTFFCALTRKTCALMRRWSPTQSATLFKCGTAEGAPQRADLGLDRSSLATLKFPGSVKCPVSSPPTMPWPPLWHKGGPGVFHRGSQLMRELI